MNIMFVSVAGGPREISIRKAIGAKRRTILLQFRSRRRALPAGRVGGIGHRLSSQSDNQVPAADVFDGFRITLLVSLFRRRRILPAWRA